MKNNSIAASIASLGRFILIFLGFAVVLVAAGVVASITAFGEFDTAGSRMSALEELENQVRFSQNGVFVNEAYYVFGQEYDSEPAVIEEYLAARQAAADETARLLREMVEAGVFDAEVYGTESQGLVDEMVARQRSQSEAFARLAAAYETGDPAQVQAEYDASREQAQAVWEALDRLVVTLERERDTAVRQFPADLNFSVQVMLGGMMICMMLALWGYRLINRLADPLLGLHDAASAIGADTFRSEIVAQARRSGGQTGRLARSLESLAQAVRARDAGLKKQVAELKQELIQSRRRRLRLVGKPGTKNTAGGVQ